ncbi:MAG: hydrogenase expression/formation protein HypE [Armatimonadetes bacterium]|nr:hydrogenase expression/formation protein HypE [Armatimonadota bacterium]
MMNTDKDLILLGHGGGGQLMQEMIARLFRPAFDNPALLTGDDSAVLEVPAGRVAFTTDSFVVTPLFFPGGDIGRLAVCGTVNDLSTSGAVPLAMTAAFILEEGLPRASLERAVVSMQKAAAEAGVPIVTGDTKVVPRGGADGMFINTAGIGVIPEGVFISGQNARPGDVVFINGTIGDHGMAILARREGLPFRTSIESDAAPLAGLVQALIAGGVVPHALRDPTRGGLAAALNEIARQSGVGIGLDEPALPFKESVRTACELLGMDALHLANEGKMVIIVAPEDAGHTEAILQRHPYSKECARIGQIVEDPARRVYIRTAYGSSRLLDVPLADPLPRIC